jgi:hypothetical protein
MGFIVELMGDITHKKDDLGLSENGVYHQPFNENICRI